MPSTEGLVAGTDTQGAPENQFGLFGAKELSHVIEACRKEVERVAAECRAQNVKFRDPDFDLQFDFVTCTHGLTESSLPAGEDVHRVTELFENPHFFPDGGAANSNAIKQGELGDCWFLAALATVSCIPGLIEKICVARDEEVGVYGFIFYGDKGWSSVIVDDMLYTKIPKYEDLDERSQAVYHEDKDKYDRIARKNGASLLFAKPGSEQETWVPLIEKAYAKFYGTYAHLEGGWSRDGIENLTGGISAEFITKDILDVERFWEEELLQVNKDRLFSACLVDVLMKPSDEPSHTTTAHGLSSNHTYAVLRAVESLGKRFVVVRNPWGKSGWKGPWSNGSSEWTREWVRILPQLEHTFGNNGQFVMEYRDFLQSFTCIERTYLLDDRWTVSSQWVNVQPKEQPVACSYGNLSFIVTMPTRSKAILVLSKVNSRAFKSIATSIVTKVDLAIVKKGSKTPLKTVKETLPFQCRSIKVEMELDEGEYFVYVRLDQWCNVKTESGLIGIQSQTLKDSLVARTLQEVIEADFVNIAKHTTESQEQKEKETPTPDGVSTASTGERAADTKPPVDAKEGGDACELGFAAEKATQTSAASAPTDDVTAKAEGTKADLKVIDRFYSRLLVATLLGCLNFLAIVTLALIWALKSPLREDNSNVSANSSSDSESVSSVDEMKPSLSTVYYCPLLHPDMPSTSLPNPSPSATQTPPGPPWKDLLKEDSKDVVLGLRVYTQTKDPAKIVYRLGGDNSG